MTPASKNLTFIQLLSQPVGHIPKYMGPLQVLIVFLLSYLLVPNMSFSFAIATENGYHSPTTETQGQRYIRHANAATIDQVPQ